MKRASNIEKLEVGTLQRIEQLQNVAHLQETGPDYWHGDGNEESATHRKYNQESIGNVAG
jgi:hypothetical protein